MVSRYSLVIAVAKRAKELKEGAPRLVEIKSKNPITIALEEIARGKVTIVIPTQAEIEAASRRQELMPPQRPRAKAAAELLLVEDELDIEDEEREDNEDSELEKAPADESEELEESVEDDEDGDDEARPLDEIVGIPGEAELDSEENEE